MSEIFCFYPSSETVYRSLLARLSPILDREGLSFHIARPEESPSPEGHWVHVSREGGCSE